MRFLVLLGVLLSVALSPPARAEWRGFATDDVNLRAGPGTEYVVLDVVPEGARMFVDTCRGGWCSVSYRGEEGYISRRFIMQTRVRDYAPRVTAEPRYYEEPDYEFSGPEYEDLPIGNDLRLYRDLQRREAYRRQLRRQRDLQDRRIHSDRRAARERQQRRAERRAALDRAERQRRRAERRNRRIDPKRPARVQPRPPRPRVVRPDVVRPDLTQAEIDALCAQGRYCPGLGAKPFNRK